MKEFQYVIQDELGLHARPAGLLVKEAGKAQSRVTMKKGDKQADCKRIFAVMSLAVKQGDTVTIVTEGADETEASARLEAFMKENF